MAKRQTKADLERRIRELEAKVARLQAENDALTHVPGTFKDFDGKSWVARPVPNNWETRDWIDRTARDRLAEASDHYTDNGPEWMVLESLWEEDFPPGIEGVVVRYVHDRDNGTYAEAIYPANRIKS